MQDNTEPTPSIAIRGRATGNLAKGRFERLETVYDADEAQQVATQIFTDTSRSIIATNDSPDIGFSATLNPYRGCEHGCIYCYARPTHEYLGLGAGLDFETKLFAKMDAPALLRAALTKKSWQPQPLGLSGITDCYQPIERKLELTRKCLQVLAEFHNPVVIITKNALVTRDLDILREMSAMNAVHVILSITTLDGDLARAMEPRASTPSLRLRAVEELAKAGIPVSINMAPIIPGLTDHEIPAILQAAANAGALSANYTILRLPHSVKELFQDWLEEHVPLQKEKILGRIRELRGGRLYDSAFGTRMGGTGIYADTIAQLFAHSRRRYGLDRPFTPLETGHFRRVDARQFSLF